MAKTAPQMLRILCATAPIRILVFFSRRSRLKSSRSRKSSERSTIWDRLGSRRSFRQAADHSVTTEWQHGAVRSSAPVRLIFRTPFDRSCPPQVLPPTGTITPQPSDSAQNSKDIPQIQKIGFSCATQGLYRVKKPSHMLLPVIAAILIFLWVFFMLADWGWEKKKRRGLDLVVRASWLGNRSERGEYEWYSWIRYLAVILVAYLNTFAVIDSKVPGSKSLVSPLRMVWAASIVIFFSIVLLAIDSYWDRRWRCALNRTYARVFWFYFWLRYPALVLATITATKRGLQPLMK